MRWRGGSPRAIAALAIVAAEVRAKGACDLAVDAIAARAGVWRYGGGERPPL